MTADCLFVATQQAQRHAPLKSAVPGAGPEARHQEIGRIGSRQLQHPLHQLVIDRELRRQRVALTAANVGQLDEERLRPVPSPDRLVGEVVRLVPQSSSEHSGPPQQDAGRY
jgi:hypothetical protein